MVAYARARTRSWISILWPETVQSIKSDTTDLAKSKELAEKHEEQRKNFIEGSKNGGMWFS